MPRKKVKLSWIMNDAARKVSLKKRRIGLLKKMSELTILCGVSAFVIIYDPKDNEPMVWPSHPEVEEMLARFEDIPEMERSMKMMNQESYLEERIEKAQEQNKKEHKKNMEIEMDYLMHQLYYGKGIHEFVLIELHRLIWLVEENTKDIRKKVDYFQQISPLPPVDGGGDDDNINNITNPTKANVMWDQWFINNPADNMVSSSTNVRTLSSAGYIMENYGFPYPTNLGMPQRNFYAGGEMGNYRMGMVVQRTINDPEFYQGSSSITATAGGHFDGGNDLGLPSFNGGNTSDGLPYELTKTNWNNNNNTNGDGGFNV